MSLQNKYPQLQHTEAANRRFSITSAKFFRTSISKSLRKRHLLEDSGNMMTLYKNIFVCEICFVTRDYPRTTQ